MTAGLPGAGIGGLFYLAATITLPMRSLWRRVRGRSDSIPWRHQVHNVAMAAGIIAGLWVAGWLLGFVVPDEMLNPGIASRAGTGTSLRTVIPAATFAFAIATLAMVLAAVEVARHVSLRASAANRARPARRLP
jgi:hypothetical protein